MQVVCKQLHMQAWQLLKSRLHAQQKHWPARCMNRAQPPLSMTYSVMCLTVNQHNSSRRAEIRNWITKSRSQLLEVVCWVELAISKSATLSIFPMLVTKICSIELRQHVLLMWLGLRLSHCLWSSSKAHILAKDVCAMTLLKYSG